MIGVISALISFLLLFIVLDSAVIGELDEHLDSQTDWTEIRADSLKPVVH
jgi:hypothetical protein